LNPQKAGRTRDEGGDAEGAAGDARVNEELLIEDIPSEARQLVPTIEQTDATSKVEQAVGVLLDARLVLLFDEPTTAPSWT